MEKNKKEKIKTEENKTEKVKSDKNKSEKAKTEKAKTEKVKTEKVKPEKDKKDKTEEAKSGNIKPEKNKSEKVKTKKSKSEDSNKKEVVATEVNQPKKDLDAVKNNGIEISSQKNNIAEVASENKDGQEKMSGEKATAEKESEKIVESTEQTIIKTEQKKSEKSEVLKQIYSIREAREKEEKERRKKEIKNRWWFKTLVVLMSIFIALFVVASGYVVYLEIQHHRIFDKQALEVYGNRSERMDVNGEFSVLSYNLGYGIFDSKFSYYNESNTFNGVSVKGSESRAESAEQASINMDSALNIATNNIYADTDFYMFQGVDIESHRSYKINMYNKIKQKFVLYSSVMALNMHSGYLFNPIFKPSGIEKSALVTMSRYTTENISLRRSMPSNKSFISKYADIDACLTITRVPIKTSKGNRYLVLINLELSKYADIDVRISQMDFLIEILKEEKAKENYIVVGGDFGMGLAGNNSFFGYKMGVPSWYENMPQGIITDLKDLGFEFYVDNTAIAKNLGTCRDGSKPYRKGENAEMIIDGFLVSSNINVTSIAVVDTAFAYSNHNPVYMSFKLK